MYFPVSNGKYSFSSGVWKSTLDLLQALNTTINAAIAKKAMSLFIKYKVNNYTKQIESTAKMLLCDLLNLVQERCMIPPPITSSSS